MSDNYVLHAIDGVGSTAQYAAPISRICDLLGVTVLAIPPGRVDLSVSDLPLVINIAPSRPGSTLYRHTTAGTDLRERTAVAGGGAFDVFPHGVDHRIVSINHHWELVIELDHSRIHRLAAEAWDGTAELTALHAGRTDPVAANLGHMIINHLRFDEADSLYVEGLTVALTARAVGFAIGKGPAVSLAGTDARIARAVDFIEAHLTEDLSLATIASAAGMSPSWLQSAFRAATGMPVWSFVQERRLKRARLMLADSSLSLAEIAFDCGFSSHSHLSRTFKRRYGVPPSEMR